MAHTPRHYVFYIKTARICAVLQAISNIQFISGENTARLSFYQKAVILRQYPQCEAIVYMSVRRS